MKTMTRIALRSIRATLADEAICRKMRGTNPFMTGRSIIFDDAWLLRAKTNRSDSWANEVVGSLDTTGQFYLSTLRLWFDCFPVPKKDKSNLRTRLESFQNVDHLGGVNELACWAFVQQEGLKGEPLPTSGSPSPDFQLYPPADCFVEVSTLNLSAKEQKAYAAMRSRALNHEETITRVFAKLSGQKQKQLKHADGKGKPGVLVIFDYTTWSAFGTEFFRALADALLGQQFGFKNLPPELSAIIYLERKVINGKIALSCRRSAIYYNPLARHALRQGLFPSLTEFRSQVAEVNHQSVDDWLWLVSTRMS
jgi:hypothetical protein